MHKYNDLLYISIIAVTLKQINVFVAMMKFIVLSEVRYKFHTHFLVRTEIKERKKKG